MDIFQQQFKCDNKDEDGVQNGGIIPVLARVETRVCEVYGSGSFLALSGGVSFAAFCAEHCAAHLVCGSSPYLDSAHRISGAGSVQTQLEGKRLSRLLEVAFLASALSDKASFGSNESATLDEGARNGVAETTFKGDDLVVMNKLIPEFPEMIYTKDTAIVHTFSRDIRRYINDNSISDMIRLRYNVKKMLGDFAFGLQNNTVIYEKNILDKIDNTYLLSLIIYILGSALLATAFLIENWNSIFSKKSKSETTT